MIKQNKHCDGLVLHEQLNAVKKEEKEKEAKTAASSQQERS